MLFTCDKKATKTLILVALVCNRINDVQNIGSPIRMLQDRGVINRCASNWEQYTINFKQCKHK